MKVEVRDYDERTIYHSPETPGYTSWVGHWLTPEGRLRCSFHQKTGPKDKITDTNIVLESADEGLTWTRVAGESSNLGGRGMAVLNDGTMVRRCLVDNKYGVQRSTDGGRTWGARIDFLKGYSVYPSLIRPLRAGRLVLMAGVACNPGDHMWTKMMFVSGDRGRSWGPPVVLMPLEQGGCEESNFCELPDDDLFWIHRVEFNAPLPASTRRDRFMTQGIVFKQGDDWRAGPVTPSPFPCSGYPEVIFTAEGLVLYLAKAGSYWTTDIGRTWHKLPMAGTGYYPQALQLANGKIICIGHVGGDDPYGSVDQSIRQQTFRLRTL